MNDNSLDLNQNLFPPNSPYTQTQQIYSFQFDYQNEAGIVSSAKIRNASIGSAQIQDASIGNAQLGTAVIGTAQIGTLTFNQISGGTALLGGTTNGNGVLSINNAGGTEVVRADNTGLTVTNGSIVVQNTSGSNVIDSQGLVSTSNFTFGTTATQSPTVNMTGFGTPKDVQNTQLSIVTTRSARVLLMVSGLDTTLSGGNYTLIEMALGGSYLTSFAYVGDVQMGVNAFFIATVGAGTTDYRIRVEGNNTVQTGFVNLQTGYLILGS